MLWMLLCVFVVVFAVIVVVVGGDHYSWACVSVGLRSVFINSTIKRHNGPGAK